MGKQAKPIVAAAALLVIVVVAPAQAQRTGDLAEPLALQVGAFRSWPHATALRDKVLAVDTNAYIAEADVEGQPLFRVRVGAFLSYGDARAAAERLRNAGYQPLLLVGDRFAKFPLTP